MAWRGVKALGNLTSQSPLRRAFCAKPPLWLSPTPQPLSTTLSPALKSGCWLSVTVPDKSMPGVSGNLRTTGLLPVMAKPSL